MNLTVGSRPQHLEDGDLVAYMDRQMDRTRLRWAGGHLESCAECAARLQALQGRATALPAWLAELDEPVSDDRRAQAMAAVEQARFRRPAGTGWGGSRGTLAAAAMVTLMLTVAFGTPQGSAWVGGVAERLGFGRPDARPLEMAPVPATPGQPATAPAADSAAATTPGEAAAPTASGPRARAGLPPGMSAPVRFNPTGNYVLLQVDSRQRVGNITIWVEDGQISEGQVVAGRTGETLEPLSDGVRVRNTRSSRADYMVRVPTRYRFIRVKIGDEPETTIAVSRANRAWVWNVSLADGG